MRKALLAAALIAAGAIFGAGADAPTWGGDASRTIAAGAQVAQLAPAAPASRPANARSDLSDKWLDAKGQYRFPPDDGFWGPSQDATLAPGTMIDRYGFPGGRFLAPAGTPYEARALPYDKAKMPYYRYEVLKPLPAKEGLAIPWFDEPGGGVQYMVDKPVQQLISEGYLKEVPGK